MILELNQNPLKFFFLSILLILCCIKTYAAPLQEKVLICGVGRNIEKAIPNTMNSIQHLAAQFADYRIIIYENNSIDHSKELLKAWANIDPKMIFLSEDLTEKRLASQLSLKFINRTELIARARNKVLDVAMQSRYDDFKYVIWADLDFLEPWDVSNIVASILHPEHEWDAIFANGAYDLLALRDPEFPIGIELLGKNYWPHVNAIWDRLVLDKKSPWRKVYSAFGGLGIYKREAIKGCRYCGVVTQDLDRAMVLWLERAQEDAFLLKEYRNQCNTASIIDLSGKKMRIPKKAGVRLRGGKTIWFSAYGKYFLPWTCEHVPFHASMAQKGHDKFFINPQIRSVPP